MSEPHGLAVAIDADARSMMESASRAARRGPSTALLVVAAAESLPPELDGWADRLTVHFPWGSLLRGLMLADPEILGGITRVTRPGGTVSMLVSVADRDRLVNLPALDQSFVACLAEAYGCRGLSLMDARPATLEDVRAAHSSWGKRLLARSDRRAWRLRFRRDSEVPTAS